MARRTTGKTSPKPLRRYSEILNGTDPYAESARRAINELTTKHGVDAVDLRIRIEWFPVCQRFGAGRRWGERFIITRKQANQLSRRLREDSDELRKAITRSFELVIGGAATGQLSVDVMCKVILRAAMLIEGSLEVTNDRKADWTVEPKRELTQLVWRVTGKPRDGLVAEIIGAILMLDSYTAEEQRKFRKRHCRPDGTDSIFAATPTPVSAII